MKKELFAGLFLIAILTGVLTNNYFLRKLSDELQSLISDTENAAINEDWASASDAAEKALELWISSDKYTHVVLRHSEIDAATDALCQLLTSVYEQDAASVAGTARQTALKLGSIIEIEKLRPGSIF